MTSDHERRALQDGGAASPASSPGSSPTSSSESELSLALLALGEVVWSCSPDGSEVHFVGEQCLELYGRPSEAFRTNPGLWREVVHPDDLAMVTPAYKRLLAGERLEIEYRIIHADGSVRWVYDRAIPLRDRDGRPSHIVGVVSDITARREVVERLHEMDAMLSSVFHAAHDGILCLDLETGRFRLANPAICRMLGHTVEEFCRLGVYDIHPGAVGPRLTRELEALVRGERQVVRGLPTLRKDGSSFLADISCTRVTLGGHSCLVGVVRDVTAETLAQQTLASSHQVLEAVLDTTPVHVALLDRDFNFVRVNRAYAAADRKHPGDFAGRNHFALYPNQEAEALFRQVRDSGVAHEAQARPFQYPLAPERGVSYWDWTLTPVLDAEHETSGLVLTLIDVTARIRAIEAAKTGEARARAIFEQSSVGMVFLNADGRILEANHRFSDLVGWERGDLPGMAIAALTHPEDRSRQAELARSALEGSQGSSGVEIRYLPRDGQPVWVNVTLSILREAEGSSTRVVAIVTDITHRKHLEAQVRESRQVLRNILDSMFTFVAVTTLDGRITDVNEAPLEVFGVSKPEVIGQLFWTAPWLVGLPEGQQKIQEAIRSAAAGATIRGDFAGQLPDGAVICIDATLSPLRDTGGAITGVVISGTDISARVAAERAVEENRQRLRNMFDSMFSFVVVCAPDGTVQEMNQAPLRASGLRREEVIGQVFWNTSFCSHSPEAREQIRRAIEGAAAGTSVRQDFTTHIGNDVVLVMDGSLAPIRNLAGEVVAVIGSGVDVTDRRQAEAALREREAGLAEAQRLAKLGSWEIDLASNLLTWSDETFRIFEIDPSRGGTSLEAFLGAIHPEDREMVTTTRLRALETRTPYEITHRLLLTGNRIRYIQERGRTDYDGEGRPLRSVGTVQDVTDRVLAERELRVRDSAIGSSITAVAMADLDGRLTYVNDAFLDLLGSSRQDDVLGRLASEFWESPESAKEALKTLRRDGRWAGEFAALRADRSVRTVQASTHIVRDSRDQPLCLMGWFLDVTDRIEADRRMARNEALFRQSFEQVAVGMVLCDLEGRFQRVNARFEQITGYTAHELAEMTFGDITHPDDLMVDLAEYRRMLAGEIQTYQMEKRYIRKDGGLIWVQLTVSGRRERGSLVQFLGVVEDISERKRAEAAVHRSQQSLLRAEQMARLGSWEWDLGSDRMEWSPELYRIYGLRPEDYPAPSLSAALATLSPAEAARLQAAYERSLATGRPEPLEFQISGDAERPRTVRAETEIVVGSNGHPTRMFGFVQDITEQKQAEARIAAQLREKEVLLREVHHRVKNNLQVISSLLYFQSTGATDPAVKTLFEESRSRVAAIALVHETLYQSADLAHVDFAAYVRRLGDGILITYGGRSEVTLTVSVLVPPLDVGMAVPCGLIVSEAVTNAMKYAFPEGRRGTVSVSLEDAGEDRYRLRVEDDGVGFGASESAATGGLGTRLMTALAEQLGGTLHLDGSRGTRVEVVFPVAA